jgi:peptide/nickel transport system permease protein
MNGKIIWNRMIHNPFFMVGAIAGIIILLLTLFTPFLTDYDPIANSLTQRFVAPQYLSEGMSNHVFGTDQLGRDILARLLYGARISFFISFIASAMCIIIGVVLGLLAGYFGGILDTIVMRVCDVVSAIPTIVLGIVVLSLFGSSIANLIGVLAITRWIRICKVTRNNVRVATKMDYINASRVLGAKSGHIIFKQIFPNVTTNIIILGSQLIGGLILTQAIFAFLGLGVLPPAPSWGHMIASGRNYLTVYPWMALVPGFALMVTAVAFNFLGDGLRDVLDPKRTVL